MRCINVKNKQIKSLKIYFKILIYFSCQHIYTYVVRFELIGFC
jgi:hypothetical protein